MVVLNLDAILFLLLSCLGQGLWQMELSKCIFNMELLNVKLNFFLGCGWLGGHGGGGFLVDREIQ